MNSSTDSPRNWWERPNFYANAAEFNREQKKLGDSALPPDVRRALDEMESRHAREAADIPERRTK